MVSKKIYIFVILALVNACTPSNHLTVNPSPSNSPDILASASLADNSNPNISSSPSTFQSVNTTPTPYQNVIVNTTPTPSFPTDAPIFSNLPFPMVTSMPENIQNNKFLLNSKEIKLITDSNIVKANNTFGLKLFSNLVKDKNDKNVFISPASLALALQMSYNGADNITKSEMAKTLGIENFSVEEVNNLNKLLLKKLNNPTSDISLKISNSLWADEKRINLKDEFIKDLTEYYSAESNEVNFSDPKTVDLINNWASKNTDGKVPKIIDKIDDDVVAYLMNAIYFKANWTRTFEISDTQNKEFTLADGTKKNLPMMSKFKGFEYLINPELKFSGASLRYGKEGKVSLFIFLPDADSSLEQFYSELNEPNLNKWLSSFYSTQGYISFPKFKTEWNKNLVDNLMNMGMIQAFKEKEADFSKMSSMNTSISSVLHNTYVDVNEKGTEAAAVSAIEYISPSSEPPTRFVADRPFFYLIRDNETKSILFMGAVNDPKYD